MKKRKIIIPMILLATSVLANVNSLTRVSAEASSTPSRINMTYYNGQANSRGFNWVTTSNITKNELQIIEKTEGLTTQNVDWSKAQKITAVSNNFYTGLNSWKAAVEDLTYGKTYIYRLGTDKYYSNPYEIEIYDGKNGLNLCWVTDAQGYSASEYSLFEKTIQACEDECGKLDGLLNTGDHSQQYKVPASNVNEWGYCIDGMSKWATTLPYTPVAGNHDQGNELFHNHFNVKLPEECDNTSMGFFYSYDIGDVHVTVLNTNDELTTSVKLNPNQVKWIEDDLKNSTATWKILMTHKGFYTTGRHVLEGDIDLLRQDVLPLVSKYHVDLVLQGHDHVYARTNEYAWNSDGKTVQTNVKYETEVIDNFAYQYAVEPNSTYHAIVNTACGHSNNVSPVCETSRLPTYFSLATSRINGYFLNTQPYTAMYGNIQVKDGKLLYRAYQVVDGKSVLYDYVGISKRTAQYLETLASELPSSFETSKMVEITKAVSVYEELSEEQKALLSQETVTKITNLAKVVRIQNYNDSRAVVKMIDELLIPSLNDSYEAELNKIQEAYDALSALTKKYVNNYAKFASYKTEYNDRKAASVVISKINALGEVASKDDEAFKSCVTAYNSLSENQKKYVSNYYSLLLKGLKVGATLD